MAIRVKASAGHCATCYGAASKAGRPVRQTDVYKYPICRVCEARLRNGLVHYVPSNGTEGEMFMERCERCANGSMDERGYMTCLLGILDRLLEAGWEDSDSAKAWHDPADLRTRDDDGSPLCPAECLHFTSRRDGEEGQRQPPPKDCPGQLTFDDLSVPVERSYAQRVTAAPEPAGR